MSNTSIINIRTEATVKEQAQELARNLGLNLSVLVNAYLKQLIRTKTVTFSLTGEPTDFLLESLKQSQAELKKGYVSPSFDKAEKALKWLKSSKRKY